MAALRITGWVACGIVLGFVLGRIAAERERGVLEGRVAGLERELRRVERPNILDSFLPRLGGAAPANVAAAPERAPNATRDAGAEGASLAQVSAARAADETPGARGSIAVVGAESPAPRRGFFRRFGERRRARRGELEVTRGDPVASASEREGDEARAPLVRFDQLATVQRARAAASRAALIEQAGLDAAQVAEVDATVARMNEQLAGYGEEMIDQVVQGEPPSPAQALGLGHDVSGILLEGQKGLDAVVGDAADAVDPAALEVWNYVDVEQWRPFLEQRMRDATDRGGEAGAGAEAP